MKYVPRAKSIYRRAVASTGIVHGANDRRTYLYVVTILRRQNGPTGGRGRAKNDRLPDPFSRRV